MCVCDKVACVCVTKLVLIKVARERGRGNYGGDEGEAYGSAKQNNKNPTQRCGEKRIIHL